MYRLFWEIDDRPSRVKLEYDISRRLFHFFNARYKRTGRNFDREDNPWLFENELPQSSYSSIKQYKSYGKSLDQVNYLYNKYIKGE
jgi:hypothetical protein